MEGLEKIEYKPVSVRDLLVEMKDLSELMIDLAYSAAVFHSDELAKEALEIEKRVDTLAYILDVNAMLAPRDVEDAESLAGVSKVAAAADIAAIIYKKLYIFYYSRNFRKVEERLGRAEVKPNHIRQGKQCIINQRRTKQLSGGMFSLRGSPYEKKYLNYDIISKTF